MGTLSRATPARHDPTAAFDAVPDKAEASYIADLSHELRQPLTVLDLRLQQFALLVHSDGNASALLDEIRADVRGLFDVVTDVLLLARMDSAGDDLRTDATFVASDVLDAMSMMDSAAGMQLTVSGAPSAVVAMSSISLRRCLTALVDNAIKHSSSDGRVTIAVVPGVHHISIEVSDFGDGIDPAVMARLFERNVYAESAQTNRPSFGIGLALVRDTAIRFGGTASVVKTDSTGTTIGMSIPKAA